MLRAPGCAGEQGRVLRPSLTRRETRKLGALAPLPREERSCRSINLMKTPQVILRILSAGLRPSQPGACAARLSSARARHSAQSTRQVSLATCQLVGQSTPTHPNPEPEPGPEPEPEPEPEPVGEAASVSARQLLRSTPPSQVSEAQSKPEQPKHGCPRRWRR